MNINKGILASNYAIDFYTSDLGGLTHEEFYEALSDGEIPDEVSIWSPFENSDAGDLLELIDNLANYLIHFSETLWDKIGEEVDIEYQKEKEKEKYMREIDEKLKQEWKNA